MQATWVRPWMYPKQRDALFCPERYSVIEGSSKSGKTLGCMIWLLEQAMQQEEHHHVWWVAPVWSQSRLAFDRIRHGLPDTIMRTNLSQMSITLANGAVMDFKSAEKPDNLYGASVYAAVLDEYTRIRPDSWHAVRSTLTATRGPIRLIGNVKGRRNWGYDLARRAEAGEPDMHYAKITAYDAIDAGILTASEIDDAQRLLPAAVFQELYLAIPSDDQGNPFGATAIRACVAPLSTAPPLAIGCDLAKSQDFTVVLGLDASGQTCLFDRWQGPWEETLLRLERLLGSTPTLMDSTGVGDPIVERLQRRYPSIEGFKFTGPSKQQLMEGLALALQNQEITYPDGPIRAELDLFEYVYSRTGVRYSSPEGTHDDTVMALGLAYHKWSERRRHHPTRILAMREPQPQSAQDQAWAAQRGRPL